MTPDTPALVLGSSSPYRGALLERLQLPFQTHSPAIDESPHAGESPAELVRRLARDKAVAVALYFPAHRIITGDQVALAPNGEILGKPGDRDAAIAQLERFSGAHVTLPTSLCLYNSATGGWQETVETFTVVFRRLDSAAIERYVDREEPFDCAGGFRAEGLGITLFERFEGRDPNTLIGLPLMALAEMLRAEGLELP
jgi:MAF protein